mmetsp:Transcript_5505/g.20804  ORF Transcript_5505/g.20804 Transcript_5505/m.20804 type:complete len:222 (+) Transcript_5505:2964-3629(+)
MRRDALQYTTNHGSENPTTPNPTTRRRPRRRRHRRRSRSPNRPTPTPRSRPSHRRNRNPNRYRRSNPNPIRSPNPCTRSNRTTRRCRCHRCRCKNHPPPYQPCRSSPRRRWRLRSVGLLRWTGAPLVGGPVSQRTQAPCAPPRGSAIPRRADTSARRATATRAPVSRRARFVSRTSPAAWRSRPPRTSPCTPVRGPGYPHCRRTRTWRANDSRPARPFPAT